MAGRGRLAFCEQDITDAVRVLKAEQQALPSVALRAAQGLARTTQDERELPHWSSFDIEGVRATRCG